MTDRPLAAERTELAVDIEAPPGEFMLETFQGLPVEQAYRAGPNSGAGLPDPGAGDELTPFGRRLYAQLADELDAASSWPSPPTVLVVNRVDPPAWRRRGPAQPDADVETAAAVDAVRQLDLAPLPAGRAQVERDAARRAAGNVGSARRACLAKFVAAGDAGLTDDELAVAVDAVPNRIATRRKELQDDGLVASTGGRRPTRSGADAIVHRVTGLGVATWHLL